MRAIVSVALILCFTATGCLNTVRIKRAPIDPTQLAEQNQKTDVPGVPFYVKAAECKQETTWLQPYYTLTLKRTVKNAGVTTTTEETQVLSLSSFQKPQLQELRKGVLAYMATSGTAEQDSKKIDADWRTIAAWPMYLPLSIAEEDLPRSKADVILAENKSTAEPVVDYSRPYYYNTPRPWVGNSSLNVTLAGDGTLTNAQAQVTDQTLSTILGALPISSVLTSVAGAALKFAEGKPTIEYQLTIQQSAYAHTHSRYVPFQMPCPVAEGGVTSNYSLSVAASPPAGTQPPPTPVAPTPPATTPEKPKP